MQIRKIDGMNAGSNVLDLSQYRLPQRTAPVASANPGRVLVDGVIRHRPTLRPLLANTISEMAEPAVLPQLAIEHVNQVPWKMLLAATAVSAAIPFAVLATPYIQTRISSASPPPAAAPAAIQAPAPVINSMAGVQDALNLFIAGKAPYGIAVINLKDGQLASTAADKQFVSASIYKLFVAQTVYKMVDSGQLSMGSRVKGTGLTVDACLNRMITVSDNPCGVALGTLIGWEKQNANFQSAGYAGTELYKNKDLKTTAGDTALLLKRLYDGTLLSPNSSQHFLGLLKAQKINNRLPQGLPAGMVIAHKTGDLFGLLHDAGIVYSPKGDYIIAALSGPWPNQAVGVSSFSDLSHQVYAEMSK